MKDIFTKQNSFSPCGFPSPAENYTERPLDLHRLLIQHPSATFFFRVHEEGKPKYGIFPGDILIIDRAAEVKKESVLLGITDGEFVLRTSREIKKQSSSEYGFHNTTDTHSFELWGVVIYAIHHVCSG